MRAAFLSDFDSSVVFFDAIVCLGAVIRGGTPHFEYVARGCVDGVMSVSLSAGVPVAFGVLTVDNQAQWPGAISRLEASDFYLNGKPLADSYVDFVKSDWDARGVVWHRLRPQTLQPGDLIRLGEAVELVFELPVAEAIETVVEAQPGAYPAVPQPLAEAPVPMPAAPQPVSQPPLPMPSEAWAAAPTPARKKSKTGLIIGIGCLVLLCLCVLAGVAIYLIFFPAEVSSITW